MVENLAKSMGGNAYQEMRGDGIMGAAGLIVRSLFAEKACRAKLPQIGLAQACVLDPAFPCGEPPSAPGSKQKLRAARSPRCGRNRDTAAEFALK